MGPPLFLARQPGGEFDRHERRTVKKFDSPAQARHAAEVLEERGITADPDLYIPPIEYDVLSEQAASGAHYVAGTIIDCVGPAPVSILSVRVLNDQGRGATLTVIAGIKYAAPHAAAAAILLDLARGKTLAPAALEKELYSATTYGKWTNSTMGAGFLDLKKAGSPSEDIVNTLEKHQLMQDQRIGNKRGQNEDNVSTRPRNSQ